MSGSPWQHIWRGVIKTWAITRETINRLFMRWIEARRALAPAMASQVQASPVVRDRLNVPGRGVEQLVCQIGEGARGRDFLADLRRLPVLGVAASCTLAAQAAAAPCQARFGVCLPVPLAEEDLDEPAVNRRHVKHLFRMTGSHRYHYLSTRRPDQATVTVGE